MDRVIYVVGHLQPDADSIGSAIAYAHLKNSLGDERVQSARAGEVDAETRFLLDRFGLPLPPLLVDAAGKNLILVDHSEAGQALPHIEQANVLEVWEHHRIGDLRFPNPIFFHCEPVGATATLIAEQYLLRGVPIPGSVAGSLLGAILSDTVAFRSPTTTEKDRSIASRLASLAGVDADSLGCDLMRVRAAAVERQSAAELVRGDFKEFRLGSNAVGIAQVHVAGAGRLNDRREEIVREMSALLGSRGLLQVILMVTDVSTRATDVWVVGDRLDLFSRALGTPTGGVLHLENCMSRKKQIVPALAREYERDLDARRSPRLPEPARAGVN